MTETKTFKARRTARTVMTTSLLSTAGLLSTTGAISTANAGSDSANSAAPIVSAAIISTNSNNNFADTLAKLQAAIDKRGFKTFAVIDHAKGAASVDADLRPTTLIIFGNPQGGTPLLQSAQTIGIDLPLKALIYEQADGSVIIAVSDIARITAAHGVTDKDPVKEKIAGALQAITQEAAN